MVTFSIFFSFSISFSFFTGDPRRPYPSDFEMRIGSLVSLGAPSGSGTSGMDVASDSAVPQPMDTGMPGAITSADSLASSRASLGAAIGGLSASTNGGMSTGIASLRVGLCIICWNHCSCCNGLVRW